MSLSARNWKSRLRLRQQAADVSAVETTADQAVTDAATAQTAADDAQEDVNALEATVTSVTGQTEQLFNAAGQVATPVVTIIPYSGGLQIVWSCTTPSNTLYYRINGGSWTAYSGSITLSPGDDCEAYATATGLTDSEIALYSA